jgi:SAM-dependent methyltransferase
LAVNVFHHFRELTAYLRRLRMSLKPDGRIVDIDFHKQDLPIGPPLEHKIAREDFLKAARRGGLQLVDEVNFLPYQYFLSLAAK